MSVIKMPVPSLRDQVSDEEWEQRVNLAACYRLIAHFGWDDLIYTHISLRVWDNENHFLFNPYGMMFEEITASSLIKVDLSGGVIMQSPYGFNPAGFIIHGAILEARADVDCVLHLHTDQGMAVSAQKQGLLPIVQTSALLQGDISYHDYEGPATDADERARLVRDLGDKNLLILRNHGTLAIGKEVVDAFLRIHRLERACKVQVLAMGGAGDVILPDDRVLERTGKQGRGETQGDHTDLLWQALLRMLDRRDHSFRD